jgi:hypothetical protein
MNMLDLNDFIEIAWPGGNFEQTFWEFKHWKLEILISIFIGNGAFLGL